MRLEAETGLPLSRRSPLNARAESVYRETKEHNTNGRPESGARLWLSVRVVITASVRVAATGLRSSTPRRRPPGWTSHGAGMQRAKSGKRRESATIRIRSLGTIVRVIRPNPSRTQEMRVDNREASSQDGDRQGVTRRSVDWSCQRSDVESRHERARETVNQPYRAEADTGMWLAGDAMIWARFEDETRVGTERGR